MKYSKAVRLGAVSTIFCGLALPVAGQVQEVQQPQSITEAGSSLESFKRVVPLVRKAPGSKEPMAPALPTDEPAAAEQADEGSEPDEHSALGAARQSPDAGAEFDIALLDSQIWNPNTGRFDKVRHRGYVDRRAPDPQGNLYQAPLIEAKPGQTVRINFRNLLPAEPDCAHTPETMNLPDTKLCYNDTNNHFHGGWVNPDGISDNVLRVLKPNPTHLYEYEYNIPQEHPAGTFWYHPHVHGSTAIQVGSGMAGPLIIRDSRWPTPVEGGFTPGDIDVLLKQSDGQPIPDKIFLLQQIQYACGQDATGQNIWNCPEGEVGQLDSYRLFLNPGPQWARSGRFTTVNGRVAAPLAEHAVAGRPERWRFIHGGISDTVQVQIYRRQQPETLVAGEPTLFEATAAANQDEVIREACNIDAGAIAMFEVATDGLTRPTMLEASSRFLQPGYRSDVVVSFDQPGDYCVIDGAVAPNQGVPGSLDTRRLLFTLTVDPADAATPPRPARDAIINMMQVAAQGGPLEAGLKAQVVAALGNGDLAFFAPHATLTSKTVNNIQNLRFALTGGLQSDAPSVPTGAGIGYRRSKPSEGVPPFGVLRYSGNPVDTIDLFLGDVDEWRLTSADVPHPFHIHVNPFEVIAVNKKVTLNGTEEVRDLTVQLDVDAQGNELPTEYLGMKGTFKDTIIIAPQAEVVLRSHYERYIGSFVLHCHILYHEDIGMMRNVRILDPGGATFAVSDVSHEQH